MKSHRGSSRALILCTLHLRAPITRVKLTSEKVLTAAVSQLVTGLIHDGFVNDVPYSGVLCGRATRKGGIPVYAQQGANEIAAYLQGQGVANVKMMNEVVEKHAQPWRKRYGGWGVRKSWTRFCPLRLSFREAITEE